MPQEWWWVRHQCLAHCCSTLKHCRVAVAPQLVAHLLLLPGIFILVSLLSRGSYPSHKCSTDLEIITQADVQLSVISSLQVNNIVCL